MVKTDRLYEILIPTLMDGKPIRTRFHRVWDKKIREISSGLTILQPAKGQWLDSGGFVCERMIPVRVMCSEDQIDAIVKITAKYYKQKAVMYYLISSHAYIRYFD